MLGGRMVWVGMSRGRFVGGRNVKAPVFLGVILICQHFAFLSKIILIFFAYALNMSVLVEQTICLYTENKRNESVRILWIRGTDLYVHWEYAECIKSWISWRIRNQNWKYFWPFIRSLDGFVWPKKSLNPKKSLASVPLRSSLKSHIKWITVYIHIYTVQYSVCIFTIVQVQLSLSGGRCAFWNYPLVHFPISLFFRDIRLRTL